MPKNEIFQTKNLVRLALVAALYAALTLRFRGLSFPAIPVPFFGDTGASVLLP